MNLVCGRPCWTVSLCPRKQLPSPASIHPPQAMLLPRLQWDPGPASHHVQEALLPLDLWVYLQSKFVLTVKLQYSIRCKTSFPTSQVPRVSLASHDTLLTFSTASVFLMPRHFVSPKTSQEPNMVDTPGAVRPVWPVSLSQIICVMLFCAFPCIDWNIVPKCVWYIFFRQTKYFCGASVEFDRLLWDMFQAKCHISLAPVSLMGSFVIFLCWKSLKIEYL